MKSVMGLLIRRNLSLYGGCIICSPLKARKLGAGSVRYLSLIAEFRSLLPNIGRGRPVSFDIGRKIQPIAAMQAKSQPAREVHSITRGAPSRLPPSAPLWRARTLTLGCVRALLLTTSSLRELADFES